MRALRGLIAAAPLRALTERCLRSTVIPHGSGGVPSFVFDIDGVLLRGKEIYEAGRKALKALHDSEGRRKHPIAFMTNGGGYSEAERAAQLSEWFEVPVEAKDVVVAHTMMRTLVDKYNAIKDSCVVVVGKGKCKEVAQGYGFERVIAIEELGAIHNTATPFIDYSHLENVSPEVEKLAQMPVCAVFSMVDSTNWGRDMQLLADIAMSDGGRIGHSSSNGDRGRTVDFYFSNPDMLFPNECSRPRLAGGAMRVALDMLMKHAYGKEFTYTQFGKPYASQYRLVENILAAQATDLGFDLFRSNSHIYAIGDNVYSDIQGANNMGFPWHSVLVRTGNFTGKDNHHIHPANLVVDDVHAAIEYTLKTPRQGRAPKQAQA